MEAISSCSPISLPPSLSRSLSPFSLLLRSLPTSSRPRPRRPNGGGRLVPSRARARSCLYIGSRRSKSEPSLSLASTRRSARRTGGGGGGPSSPRGERKRERGGQADSLAESTPPVQPARGLRGRGRGRGTSSVADARVLRGGGKRGRMRERKERRAIDLTNRARARARISRN